MGYEEKFRLYFKEDVDKEKVEVRNNYIMSPEFSRNYLDYLDYVNKKIEEAGNNIGKNLIFMDNYDGDVHSSNTKKQISIVS